MDHLSASEAAYRVSNQDALEDELFDELERDDAIEKYREKRIQEFKANAQLITDMQQNAHGVYSELTTEKDFLHLTTKTPFVIVHFFHTSFKRCQIIDKHFDVLAKKHFTTKFAKINVDTAPFFVNKLKVQVLPCVVVFIDGVTVDRIVGFDELGNKDDFTTQALEKRLAKSGVIAVDANNSMVKPKLVSRGIKDSGLIFSEM